MFVGGRECDLIPNVESLIKPLPLFLSIMADEDESGLSLCVSEGGKCSRRSTHSSAEAVLFGLSLGLVDMIGLLGS